MILCTLALVGVCIAKKKFMDQVNPDEKSSKENSHEH